LVYPSVLALRASVPFAVLANPVVLLFRAQLPTAVLVSIFPPHLPTVTPLTRISQAISRSAPGVIVPIPSLPVVLSQKSCDDWMSPPRVEPNASCHGVNPERSPPVSAHILTVSPIRVIPPVKVRMFSLLLKVFQSVDERYPSKPDVA
jgi:hypothetical protein